MEEPIRSQWQVRCAFNGFCKRVLKREAIDAHRQTQRQQRQVVTFSDLAPHDEQQLYSLDTYFKDEAAKAFNVGGKKITPKLIADALHSLPDDKRKAVLLYYFMEMSDVEIGEMLNIPRSTVQYRRTSSFELLKRFLEEHADDWDDW